MPTPPLPDWIRHAQVPGYTTAHQLCPDEPRLFGTESLYGDWAGSVLLLAKDFGPSRILRARLAAGDPRPYRHEPGMLANVRLRELAAPVEELGLLYGSALANLLRDDGRVSGALPNREQALAYGAQVARFTVERMPALRWIVCLGLEAWECSRSALGLEGDWRAHRDSGEPLGPLVAAFHPSARVSRERMERPWEALALAGARLIIEDVRARRAQEGRGQR
jgi:hypothetical protein